MPFLADSMKLKINTPASAKLPPRVFMEGRGERAHAHADASLETDMWAASVFDDISANIDLDPKAANAAPPLSGFARAEKFNKCAMQYHAPAKGTAVAPIRRDLLHGVYMMQEKAASSTVRNGFTNFQRTNTDMFADSEMTRFTFVRDPLSRTISALHECLQFRGATKFREQWLGMTTVEGKEVTPELSELVLKAFTEIVGLLEQDKFPNAHFAGQRSRLDPPSKHTMDFIGAVSSMEDDWEELRLYQAKRFNVTFPPFPSEPHRLSRSTAMQLMNISIMPGSLAQRICTVYRDDYCCFGLPIPEQCTVEC